MSAHGHTPESSRSIGANGAAGAAGAASAAGASSAPASSVSLTLRFDTYELDFARKELRREGALVALQPTPLRVLLYLAEHRDRTVPRRELLDAIWPGVVVGDEALTTALAEARHAVGDDGAAQRVIRTLKGAGYRFVAEVEEAAERAPAATSRSRWRWAVSLAGAVAAVALVTAAVLRPSAPPAPSEPAPFGIVVLPLASLTADAETRALADGLTDRLTNMLAQAGYPVVARTTAALWRERGTDVRELERGLGVSHLIEGSVQRADGRVRATLQLVATDDGRALWSEVFENASSDSFAIQDQIANRVSVKAFEYVWNDTEVANQPELARLSKRWVEMRALFFANRFDDHLAAGERLLHDMPEREPFLGMRTFTLGLMSVAWRNKYGWENHPFAEAGPKLLEYARAAVQISPDDPLMQHFLAQALMHHWRWEEAEQALQRACAVAPREGMVCGATTWQLCAATGCPQQLEGARLWTEKYPGHFSAWLMYSISLSNEGRDEEALAAQLHAREMSEQFQDEAPLRFWRLGRRAEAINALRRHLAARKAQDYLREIDSVAGASPEIVMRRSAELLARRDPVVMSAIPNPACKGALTFAELGDRAAMLGALEQSFRAREVCLEVFSTARIFDPIRDDLRFRAIVAKMGLAPYHAKYLKQPSATQPVAWPLPSDSAPVAQREASAAP
jgi:TolB-like protein/DNA-binding winged helix-turn-helix (wHTH) protein